MTDEKTGKSPQEKDHAAKTEKVEETATENEKDVASSVKEDAASAVGKAVDKAKAAFDKVPTDEFTATANKVANKAQDTAQKAGKAVNTILEDHGIDASKLGRALKNDAKSVATVTIGGVKVVGEKLTSALDALSNKIDSAQETDIDEDEESE